LEAQNKNTLVRTRKGLLSVNMCNKQWQTTTSRVIWDRQPEAILLPVLGSCYLLPVTCSLGS